MSETLTEAATFIEQGHVRVGPHAVTDPAVSAAQGKGLKGFIGFYSRRGSRNLETGDHLGHPQVSCPRTAVQPLRMLVAVWLSRAKQCSTVRNVEPV